jgi:hypothetical protein
MFIPGGFLPIREALIRLAQARYPTLPIRRYVDGHFRPSMRRDPLRAALMWTDPFEEQPTSGTIRVETEARSDNSGDGRQHEPPPDAIAAWNALEAARLELRQALGDGALIARLQDATGEQGFIPAHVWRSEVGLSALRWCSTRPLGGDVFVHEAEFHAWIERKACLAASDPVEVTESPAVRPASNGTIHAAILRVYVHKSGLDLTDIVAKSATCVGKRAIESAVDGIDAGLSACGSWSSPAAA